nr:hypothetical protein [Tanacetum cinerariifolium]
MKNISSDDEKYDIPEDDDVSAVPWDDVIIIGPSDTPLCYLCTCEHCGNILIDGACLKCNSGAGNSFTYDPIPESFNEVIESSRKGQNWIKTGQKREAWLKKAQEKDKIGSKPDKNRKRGEAEKSLKQLQLKKDQEKDKIGSKPDKNGELGAKWITPSLVGLILSEEFQSDPKTFP